MSKAFLRFYPTPHDHEVAKLTALALGLMWIEQYIPSPLPGVKPGIANIVTLVLLEKYDFKTVMWVHLLRVLAGSIFFGTFLTPSFFLSLAGAIGSLGVLFWTRWLPSRFFSLTSSSIISAFAHIFCQLSVVYFWLIPHSHLRYMLPLFATSALFFGLLNGLIATYWASRWEKE